MCQYRAAGKRVVLRGFWVDDDDADGYLTIYESWTVREDSKFNGWLNGFQNFCFQFSMEIINGSEGNNFFV